jgi:hypothetical protein
MRHRLQAVAMEPAHGLWRPNQDLGRRTNGVKWQVVEL